MKELELKEGETIKVIGKEGKSFLVITNVNGEIFTRTDYRREDD